MGTEKPATFSLLQPTDCLPLLPLGMSEDRGLSNNPEAAGKY